MLPTDNSRAVWADLLAARPEAPRSGPQWSHESDDLDVTLLSWENGRSVEAHLNDEVDVLWVGIEGTGVVTIGENEHELRPGVAVLIPRGTRRSLASTCERLLYLSVHKRRRGLMPTLGGRRLEPAPRG